MTRFRLHTTADVEDIGGYDALGERLPPLRRRRFKAVPIRVVIPNLVTLAALAMGLTSIRFAVEGKYQIAVVAVLGAAVLDGLDGRIARAIRGTSRFGAELDSLADFVDFGVAPALILYLSTLREIESFGWFATLVFAVAAALRLARFNTMLDDPDKPAWRDHFFVGMPAPAGAVVGLLPLYMHLSGVIAPGFRLPVAADIGYVILIALLMASRVPHFSGKRIGRIPREYFMLVLFGIAAGLMLLASFPMEVMILVSLCYMATIPLAIRQYRRFERADAARAAARTDRPARPVTGAASP